VRAPGGGGGCGGRARRREQQQQRRRRRSLRRAIIKHITSTGSKLINEVKTVVVTRASTRSFERAVPVPCLINDVKTISN
jgi:hypothetical protein